MVTKVGNQILATLESAARPWICPEIEGVRTAAGLDNKVWEPSELKELCDRVCSGNSLSDLTLAFECSEEEVLRTITAFGSWLSTAVGPGESNLDGFDEQLELFAMPTDARPNVHVHDSLRPQPRRNEGALRAITWHRPSLDIIKTYRLRQDNSGATEVLLDSTVTAIAAFARQGRLADVTKVNPKDEVFQKMICSGFDVLEVYRQDAIHGVAALAGLKEDPAGMANAVRKARTLFPEEARMMERALETENAIHVRKATDFIYRRIANNPAAYAAVGPQSLSIPQVLNICTAHGLSQESDSSIPARARDLLEAHGLKREVEYLLRPAVAAIESGTETEFLASLGIDL